MAFAPAVAACVLAMTLSACGDKRTAAHTEPSSAGTASPSPTTCPGTGYNVHAIKTDIANRAAAGDLDRTSRAHALLSPDDPRSFIARVSGDQLRAAGIIPSRDWSNDLFLVVNHGSFSRDQVPVPPPVMPANATPVPADARVLDWAIYVYDHATHRITSALAGPDGPCLHD